MIVIGHNNERNLVRVPQNERRLLGDFVDGVLEDVALPLGHGGDRRRAHDGRAFISQGDFDRALHLQRERELRGEA